MVWTEAPFEVMVDIVQLKQQGLRVCEGIGLVGLNSCGLDVSRLLQFTPFIWYLALSTFSRTCPAWNGVVLMDLLFHVRQRRPGGLD